MSGSRVAPRLLSIATARPAPVLAQERIARLGAVTAPGSSADAASGDVDPDRVAPLFARVGVEERAIVVADAHRNGDARTGSWFYDGRPPPGTGARMRAYDTAAGPLAVEGARGAVERAGIAPGSVTHLVTASCTGFAAPGVDLAIIRDLGLPAGVARTHVGFMGCHAAVNALRVASGFASQDPGSVVLVCCVELCSIHLQHEDAPERDVVNALFGDGAAAAVVRGGRHEHRGEHTGDAAKNEVAADELGGFSSRVWPDGAGSMRWDITDAGFRMALGRDVPRRIRAGVGPWIEPWLESHGLGIGDVGSWAIHPGGPRVIDAVRDGLGLDEALCAPTRSVLARAGNMSSATLLFVLDELRRIDSPGPTVAVAFGPGLAGEAMLLGA